MGGGSSSSAPQFDANSAINQQATSNLDTAAASQAMSQTNQVTPYGSLTYNQSGSYTDPFTGTSVPTYTATTQLSPAEQGLLGQAQGVQSGELNTAQSMLPGVQNTLSSEGNLLQNYGSNTDQAYNDLMARQNQSYNLQNEQLQSQLANQGINPGTAAYNNAYIPLNQQRVDATNQAQLQATGLAGQDIQNALAAGTGGINQLLALTGQGGQVTNPNLTNTPQSNVAGTNTEAPQIAQYQGQLSAYNQGLQNNQATMGGLFGLGGSVLGGLAGNTGLASGLFGGAGGGSTNSLIASLLATGGGVAP